MEKPKQEVLPMPWRDSHALHIFAPIEEPYGNNWVEQILGTTVKPLYERYRKDIRWLWVTRYSDRYNEENPPVGCPLPERHRSNGDYRYIIFRASVKDESKESLHAEALQLAKAAGCYTDPGGWLAYDVVADLGSDRFISSDAHYEERAQRAQLIAYFIDATVKLMIDALVQDKNGRWSLEQSNHTQNPKGSFFESVHHLLCNATGVPTTVLLIIRDNQLRYVGTYWMPYLPDVDPQQDVTQEIRLNY